MKKLNIIFIILFLISCKLLSPDDTTPPEIQLTIAGDLTEISRGVTLYLEIEDDSKIDYVSIIIDDTTAITVESNFDTIRFDVTPFADESEHILYVEVADKEGNIGESEKIDVVITEFPGWRIYDEIEMEWLAPVAVDENGLVWIGSGWGWNGLHIFDPVNNIWTHLNSDNSNLQTNHITDIKIIEGSRVWLANSTHVIQYDFMNQRWISFINLPEAEGYTQETEAWSICIDRNYNLWIGTYSGLIHYRGNILNEWYTWPDIPSPRIWDLISTNDNIIFAATDNGGIFSIANNNLIKYDFFTGIYGDFTTLSIDSSGNIWASQQGYQSYLYNGTQWGALPASDIMHEPMIITKDQLFYTQAKNRGLVVGDGTEWFYFDTIDSPFVDTKYYINDGNFDRSLHREALAEAPNGDIWMVAGGKLMRYRPSLGGYP